MRMEQKHCDATETLKKAGLTKTDQRVAVLDALIYADCPLKAGDILQRSSRQIKINRVTVYRILSLLCDHKIVREMSFEHGISHYEMACVHNPVHPHFYCRRCGRITCLPPLTLSQAWDWLSQPSDFSVERINVQLIGLCADCRNNENSNSVASEGFIKTSGGKV